jgi:hypothetical protein
MNDKTEQEGVRSPDRSVDWFLLVLAVAASIATGVLLYLLNIRELGLGQLVILAGLGGIVGTSLFPLLEQTSEKGSNEQRSERKLKGFTGLMIKSTPVITRLLVYVIGGFGFAAAAFVVTTALLLDEPGEATSALGTAAYGGVVGFSVGRTITRMSLRKTSDEAGPSPAVVTALGEFEDQLDQLFGQPLLNYDGYAIARWHASRTSSEVLGKIHVHMEARKVREERKDLAENTRSESETETTQPSPPKQEVRVLMQGGKDADRVPFAVSVISGAFDVQPHRLVLAAPSEGTSETLEFTLLNPQPTEGDKDSVTREAQSSDSEPSTAAVLIDVSQAGQTIQLLEMEVSSP